MAERQQFCTFFIDRQLFGIEVERVQEIIRYQTITRIPLAPPPVAGLINLRGQIVPAVEVRRCLGLPERATHQLPTNVVIRTEDGTVSLLVDEIGDVCDVAEDEYEAPPDNLRGDRRNLIRGVYKLERGLLMVVSTEAVLSVATSRPSADSRGLSPSSQKEHSTHGSN